MKEEYEKFARLFAETLVRRDFAAAHAFFAPWLQAEISPEDFRAVIETWLTNMNEVWELEELIYPEDFSVSDNRSTLESLKMDHGWRAPRQIPAAITEENFRQWTVIQFLPAENDPRIDFDAWFDFWFILVETGGALRIGFFELADAD